MDNEREFRFKIDSYTPSTLPLRRLAEYMIEVAQLLGNEQSVHFVSLETGSAVLVQAIDEPAYPKVVSRVEALARGDAPPEVARAFAKLDAMLANDNAKGVLSGPNGTTVINFPGRDRPEALEYGFFWQEGSLDGTLIRVGGKDDTVPVHLQNGEKIYPCNTSRDIARQMAQFLFTAPLRVFGSGRWRRTPEGPWEMQKFQVSRFEVLDDQNLTTVVNRLQSVPGSGWAGVEDPLSEIQSLRGDDRVH